MWFLGRSEKNTAALMVASSPELVESFVAKKAATATSDPEKAAVTAINGLIKKLKVETAKKEADQNADDITKLFNDIGDQLVILMSGTSWGTDANPVLLEYPKPRVSTYASVLLGPHASDWIPQPEFETIAADPTAKTKDAKTLFGKRVTDADWNAVGRKLTRFGPTKPGEPLPQGGGAIGVAADNQVQVGLKFEYTPGKTKGGAKLNSLLRPYGFRPGKDDRDADHVIEIQLIGLSKGDQVENLWPLRSKDNRHGLSLSEADVEIGGTPKKKMKLSAAAAKKKPLKVMLKSTTTPK